MMCVLFPPLCLAGVTHELDGIVLAVVAADGVFDGGHVILVFFVEDVGCNFHQLLDDAGWWCTVV